MSDCCEACFPALSRAARFPALKLSFYVRVFEAQILVFLAQSGVFLSDCFAVGFLVCYSEPVLIFESAHAQIPDFRTRL